LTSRIAGLLGLCALASLSQAGVFRHPLTTEAAIGTARFMKDSSSTSSVNPQGVMSVSPDGNRYLIRVVRGDIKRDGVTMILLTGELRSLSAASQPRAVASLFTSGRGSGENDIGPHHDTYELAPPRWLANDYVAFLWSNAQDIRQVIGVDLSTGETQFLTHHPTHVLAFDANEDQLVLYNAQVSTAAPNPAELMKQGYAVAERTDPFSLFRGDLSGASFGDRLMNSEWFLQKGIQARPHEIQVAGRDITPDNRNLIFLSPNGKLALVSTHAPALRTDWDKYINPWMRKFMEAARFGTEPGFERNVHQLFLIDLERLSSRPLWNAGTYFYLSQAAWSPDSRSILLAPTFLPADRADARGLAGYAAAVVDVATGRYRQLPVTLASDWPEVETVRWLSANEVQISERLTGQPRQHRFKKSGEQWRLTDGPTSNERAPALRIELREDLNTPPKLFAVDSATGEERMMLDPNPDLTSNYSLGHVEKISGKLGSGETWEGLLFYPVGHRQGRRYPLVIQSVYGTTASFKDIFTLYGDQMVGLGPAQIAPYAAQVIANRGMAVVHLKAHIELSNSVEGKKRMEAFELVAERMAASGLVDRSKVGIAGFSRNGYYVEYTLSHSAFPFAAGIAADNWDPSYYQQILMGHSEQTASVNGGAPFGEGLQRWLEHAPGFNADRIRAPLWKVAQQGGRFSVLAGWEIFSRLRYLKKPAEYYVMPDAEHHGAHNTQNPRQLRAVQEGSVDWFDFWLNGHEEADDKKSSQYERWRKLRQLHESSDGSLGSTSRP
jgi:hypothetical protein